jgi:TM2 domain-containing membrane protein YozV
MGKTSSLQTGRHIMKDKNVAGILALFLGWLGFHRFYLGQTGLGIVYLIFCWFPLTWLIALVDGISLLTMDQQRFDEKYNGAFSERSNIERTREYQRPDRQHSFPNEDRKKRRNFFENKPNPYKQSGLEKFKDYDYPGAIEDFKKSIELAPRDVATHFNLACAYSLTEDARKAFSHLDKAIEFGFRDFNKIKEHPALAFLRIQDEFQDFEMNGFRLRKTAPPAKEDLLDTPPDLLDQLKKLSNLREQGMLTQREFDEQKRRLLR